MKIIISPSKTQSFDHQQKGQEIVLKPETKKLFSIIKGLSKENLGKMLKIKGQLLDETYVDYQKDFFDKPFGNAVDIYTGVVFDQLELGKYNPSQKDYINDNLRILSAMYGVLRPDDYVYPYRLDMTIRVPEINLYNYWQKIVENHFKDENLIINLASKEFSKMLQNYSGRIIDIEFYEETKVKDLKIVSYNAKKCRGQMLNFMIKNKVDDISLIKDFCFDGYKYSENLSNKDKLIFVRQID